MSKLEKYYAEKEKSTNETALNNYYVKEIREKTEEKPKYIEIETKYKYKLHYRLKWWLDILINDLHQNDDALIIVVAAEGSGKTVFGSQICDYMSNKLNTIYNVDNVHFDGQTYIDKSLASPQFTINHLDESRRALNKMRAISTGNVEFMNFLSECRSQNQIHLVILPAYADLEQYVAIHRVKMLISLEKKRDPITQELIRGTFKVHITKNKQDLKEQWDRKYNEFTSSMTAFSGKFDNVFCLDKEAYEKKKEEAKKERYSSKEEETGEKVTNNFLVTNENQDLSIDDTKLINYMNQGFKKKAIVQKMKITESRYDNLKYKLQQKGLIPKKEMPEVFKKHWEQKRLQKSLNT